jgi:hypothetical protein
MMQLGSSKYSGSQGHQTSQIVENKSFLQHFIWNRLYALCSLYDAPIISFTCDMPGRWLDKPHNGTSLKCVFMHTESWQKRENMIVILLSHADAFLHDLISTAGFLMETGGSLHSTPLEKCLLKTKNISWWQGTTHRPENLNKVNGYSWLTKF